MGVEGLEGVELGVERGIRGCWSRCIGVRGFWNGCREGLEGVEVGVEGLEGVEVGVDRGGL